jgi:hypothetical protein
MVLNGSLAGLNILKTQGDGCRSMKYMDALSRVDDAESMSTEVEMIFVPEESRSNAAEVPNFSGPRLCRCYPRLELRNFGSEKAASSILTNDGLQTWHYLAMKRVVLGSLKYGQWT